MTATSIVALQALIALGGSVVVVQSYRGYTRNESRPLAFFGLGIGLLTVGPPVLTAMFTFTGPATGLFETVLLMRVAGLLSLLYAFTRA
jgi:hypothetical protein